MSCVSKVYTLFFDITDKLTEDASTMLNLQENKAECIRTMLYDFISVYGIVRGYTEIEKKERLKKFFGYTGYPEETVHTPEPEQKAKGKRKCRCQFEISFSSSLERLPYDAFVMMHLQESKAGFIRELFMDFISAHGAVSNLASICEKERRERFFGYVERTTVPAEQPGRTVKIMQEKSIEIRQHYEGTRYLFSNIIYTAPDGKKVSLSI